MPCGKTVSTECLYILRSLRKEGLDQAEIDHLFNRIVMPKITYGLPVYGSSDADLTIMSASWIGVIKGIIFLILSVSISY